MRRIFALPAVLSVVVAAACGSSESSSPGASASAGSAGSTSAGSAGSTSAGSAGSTAAGAAGAGGAAGSSAKTTTVFDDVRITSNQAGPNFQHADAPLDFGSAPLAKATFIVDLRSTCFPFEQWKTSPPPSGQSWPAECDAFDRNFELSLDEPADASGPPAFEVMRAITPFGGPLHLEIDVTDLANARPGPHTARVHIATWSDGAGKVSGSNGGWNVTTKLVLEPGKPPRDVRAAIPLVNKSHGATDPFGEVEFELPAGTKSARIDYRVTGHGGPNTDTGCIGPAEEFCKRTHKLFADGVERDNVQPWRTNCADLCTKATHPMFKEYCAENPCGAVQSVQAPRANWCPGSLTPPIAFAAEEHQKPGKHTFRYEISRLKDGGSWRTSAIVFAYGD